MNIATDSKNWRMGLSKAYQLAYVNPQILFERKKIMSVKIVTNSATLSRLAFQLGKTRKEGDPERIEKAENELESYKQICLKSDEIIPGRTGDL